MRDKRGANITRNIPSPNQTSVCSCTANSDETSITLPECSMHNLMHEGSYGLSWIMHKGPWQTRFETKGSVGKGNGPTLFSACLIALSIIHPIQDSAASNLSPAPGSDFENITASESLPVTFTQIPLPLPAPQLSLSKITSECGPRCTPHAEKPGLSKQTVGAAALRRMEGEEARGQGEGTASGGVLHFGRGGSGGERECSLHGRVRARRLFPRLRRFSAARGNRKPAPLCLLCVRP